MTRSIPARRRVKASTGDSVFYAVINVVMLLIVLVVLIPLINVVASSFSSGKAVQAGKVFLWPVDFSLEGYRTVFQYKTVVSGYINSIKYMIVGTVINVCITLICAYPLARRTLPFRNLIMLLFTFTMYFSGGMIPGYLLVKQLGLLNSMWALILPGALSVYNMIIARTFIQNNIPSEMLEAAQIDGCSDIRFFFVMVLPLSTAVIAVITLYYAVGHWNSWFNAFLYLSDRDKYPLQLVLRDILIVNQIDMTLIDDPEIIDRMTGLANLLKYSLIVVATVPMMVLYPFVQKFFIKGVMIGSVKG